MHTAKRRARGRGQRWGLTAALLLGVLAMAGLSRGEQASAAAVHAAPRAGAPGGDIPDTAVYLRYQGHGFSVEYVEGWVQTTGAHAVTFGDKDSSVVVELRPRVSGSLTTYEQRVDLPRLAHSAGFQRGTLSHATIAGYPALRLRYRSRSTPDEVTGKTVVLQSDRYYVDGPKALAVLTLSTPLGVDNVDGFRRIAQSFRYR